MTKEYNTVLDAKRSLKAHIQFMEKLVKDLNLLDKALRGRTVVAAWCIHRFFEKKLIEEVQEIISQNTIPVEKAPSPIITN